MSLTRKLSPVTRNHIGMNVSVHFQKIFDKSKKAETTGKRQPLGSVYETQKTLQIGT